MPALIGSVALRSLQTEYVYIVGTQTLRCIIEYNCTLYLVQLTRLTQKESEHLHRSA